MNSIYSTGRYKTYLLVEYTAEFLNLNKMNDDILFRANKRSELIVTCKRNINIVAHKSDHLIVVCMYVALERPTYDASKIIK